MSVIPSRQIVGQYLKIDHALFAPLPLQFIIHSRQNLALFYIRSWKSVIKFWEFLHIEYKYWGFSMFQKLLHFGTR
jgi:hypothetical protein